MSEHSKLPWSFASGEHDMDECEGYGLGSIVDSNGLRIAEIWNDYDNPLEAAANAALIVHRVNCHDELVEALKLIVAAYDCDGEVMPQDIQRAREAIAKSEAR